MHTLSMEQRYNYITNVVPSFTRKYFRVKPLCLRSEDDKISELRNASAICIGRFIRHNKLDFSLSMLNPTGKINFSLRKNLIKISSRRLLRLCFKLFPNIKQQLNLDFYAFTAFYALRRCQETPQGSHTKTRMKIREESTAISSILQQLKNIILDKFYSKTTETDCSETHVRALIETLDSKLLNLKKLGRESLDVFSSKIAIAWRNNSLKQKILDTRSLVNSVVKQNFSKKEIFTLLASNRTKLLSSFICVTANVVHNYHSTESPYDIQEQLHLRDQNRGYGLLFALICENNLDNAISPNEQGTMTHSIRKNMHCLSTSCRQLLARFTVDQNALDFLIENTAAAQVFLACESTFQRHVDFLQEDSKIYRNLQIQANIQLHEAFQSLNIDWLYIHDARRNKHSVHRCSQSLHTLKAAQIEQPSSVEYLSIGFLFRTSNIQLPPDHDISNSLDMNSSRLQEVMKVLNLSDIAIYNLYIRDFQPFESHEQLLHGDCLFYTTIAREIEKVVSLQYFIPKKRSHPQIFWNTNRRELSGQNPKLYNIVRGIKRIPSLFHISSCLDNILDLYTRFFNQTGIDKPSMNPKLVSSLKELIDHTTRLISKNLKHGYALKQSFPKILTLLNRRVHAFERCLRNIDNSCRENKKRDINSATRNLYHTVRLIHSTGWQIQLADTNEYLLQILPHSRDELRTLIKSKFDEIYSSQYSIPKLIQTVQNLRKKTALPRIINSTNLHMVIVCTIIETAANLFTQQLVHDYPETLKFEMDCLWKTADWMLFDTFLHTLWQAIQEQIGRPDPNLNDTLESSITRALSEFEPWGKKRSGWEMDIINAVNTNLEEANHSFKLHASNSTPPTEIGGSVSDLYRTYATCNFPQAPQGDIFRQILDNRIKKNIFNLRNSLATHEEVFGNVYLKAFHYNSE